MTSSLIHDTESNTDPGVKPSAPALERATRAQAFAVLQAGITADMTVPEVTTFYQFEAGGVFHLHFDDDETAAVDMWAAYLGLAPAALTGRVRQSGERHWRTYKASIYRHPWLLNGWTIEVSCTVTVDVKLSATAAVTA